MKKMVLLVQLLLIGSALYSAQIGEEKLLTKGKPPEWLTISKDGEFVGSVQDEDESKARNEALADARKQIIDSLGIEMSKETLREITQSGSTAEIGIQQSGAKIKTESVAKNILQVKPSQWYVERWQKTLESGVNYYYKVYVLVKFSKEQHEMFINSMIQQIEELSGQAMASAKTLDESGKKVESIVEYFNVMNAVRTLNKITGIDPAKLTAIKSMQRESMQPIREFFGQSKVSSARPNISSQPGDDLPEPLKINYMYKGKPLSGMPVKFRFVEGAGNLTSSVITDQDGIAMISVSGVQPAKNKDTAIIEATPDVELDETGVPVIRITIDMSRKILIRIIEKNCGQKQPFSKLENALIQGLVKEKFKCVEPNTANSLVEDGDIGQILNGEDAIIKLIAEKGVANWILIGEVNALESSKIQEGYVFSRANASVKIIRMDNGQVIYADNMEQKSAGMDAVKAGSKAIDSVTQKFAPKIMQSFTELLK